MSETNWSGNYEYRAQRIARPSSVAELQEIIAAAPEGETLRALGTRHTFNDVADAGASGTLIATGSLPAEVTVDPATRTARVGGGLRYGDVAIELERQGWALHNLASLPHISIAGAVATATHGSGSGNGNLATAVAGLTFVDGSGELVILRRGDAGFDGAVVALGALGVATELELDIVPSFEIAQTVSLGVPFGAVPEVLDAAYSVSVFTDWVDESANQLWVKARVDAPAPELAAFGPLTPASRKMHPIASAPAEACTEQFGVPGPWHERLPHFRLDFTPSSGAEIQSEFLLPRGRAVEAVEALRGIGAAIRPLLLISEIRAIAADALWLSTASTTGADAWADGAVAFHFTFVRDQAGVEALLPAVEGALAPFGARPHWGKVFVSDPDAVTALYPRFADFRALAARYDAKRVFVNPFLEHLGL